MKKTTIHSTKMNQKGAIHVTQTRTNDDNEHDDSTTTTTTDIFFQTSILSLASSIREIRHVSNVAMCLREKEKKKQTNHNINSGNHSNKDENDNTDTDDNNNQQQQKKFMILDKLRKIENMLNTAENCFTRLNQVVQSEKKVLLEIETITLPSAKLHYDQLIKMKHDLLFVRQQQPQHEGTLSPENEQMYHHEVRDHNSNHNCEYRQQYLNHHNVVVDHDGKENTKFQNGTILETMKKYTKSSSSTTNATSTQQQQKIRGQKSQPLKIYNQHQQKEEEEGSSSYCFETQQIRTSRNRRRASTLPFPLLADEGREQNDPNKRFNPFQQQLSTTNVSVPSRTSETLSRTQYKRRDSMDPQVLIPRHQPTIPDPSIYFDGNKHKVKFESSTMHSTSSRRKSIFHFDRTTTANNNNNNQTTTNDKVINTFEMTRVQQYELDTIPKTVRGRISRPMLNDAISDIESICRKKLIYYAIHHYDKMKNDNHTTDQPANHHHHRYNHEFDPDRIVYNQYIHSTIRNHNNNELVPSTTTATKMNDSPLIHTSSSSSRNCDTAILTEQEIRQECSFFRMGESTARSILLVLRSLNRIQQFPSKKAGQVIYSISTQTTTTTQHCTK